MFENGLVLEGGGNRSIFSSGVLDAFIENDITFPYIIGVSAGSCNATSYIAKNHRRQHDIIITYANDKRYMGLSNIIKGHSFLNTDWIFGELAYDILPLNHDEFENSGTTLCVVTANAKTGKAEYFYPKSFREGCPELKASCSMPVVTKGVVLGDELYFDGGMIDSIPLQRAFDDGCKKAVVILTQHKGFEKKPVKSAAVKAMKKYPKIAEAIAVRHEMYNEQLRLVEQAENDGTAFVIRPGTPLGITSLERDTSKLEAIYQLGYKQGLRSINEIKAFLSK